MQLVMNAPPLLNSTVSEAEAHYAATVYTAAYVDPTFIVAPGTLVQSRSHQHPVWQFVIRCEDGPLDVIAVNAQGFSGRAEVIPLADDRIRVIREKAAIYAARRQGSLPISENGYILGEYARRCAERYLGDQIGMFFNAVDPLFAPGDLPRWQVTIVFKRYHCGPFTLGVMDVDARTGEPISLSKTQLKRIRERAHAFIQFQTQTATT